MHSAKKKKKKKDVVTAANIFKLISNENARMLWSDFMQL